jgi:hypothetical protein
MAAAATSTVTMVDSELSIFQNRLRVLRIAGRNGDTAADYGATLPLLFTREGSGASVTLGTLVSDFGSVLSTSASGVQVEVLNVGTDGTTFDVRFTNHTANAQRTWITVT